MENLPSGAKKICSLCHSMFLLEALLQTPLYPQEPGFVETEAYTNWGTLFKKKITKLQYKIKHKVLEGAQTSERLWNLIIISFKKINFCPNRKERG